MLRWLVVILLGAVAPTVWVASLGQWALIYPSVAELVWTSVSAKNSLIFVALDLLHALLLGFMFSLLLRLLSKNDWKQTGAIFCLAFLLFFFGTSFIQAANTNEVAALVIMSAMGVLAFLASTLGFSALFARSRRHADA